ncbi:MAG: class II aldolase/adducin family protein [Defluviitaleaceae bacterium]|nr:class II aldolase/adducin family protein [Defluviitaleaceae bacterium]
MKFNLLHPADQIVAIMSRIYDSGLTTTSGGNLSILDDNGDIWISPGGIDKGTLTRSDICCVKPDGKIVGPHKPSVELPFHASIYKKRSDIRAVLHAHPPKLVAFSVIRRLPELNLTSNSRRTCGSIAIAPYALPGSAELGEKIAAEFVKGYNIVVLENHGLVIGSDNLFDCFMKFETLEATAKLQINASKLGALKMFEDSELNLASIRDHMTMDDFIVGRHSSEECAARRDMATLIKRSYRQGLFGSTRGTYSVRLSDGSFLITPFGVDRAYMTESDLVLIKNGMKEYGKIPSRSVRLHKLIYEKHPNIHSVLGAEPPHAMAFAVTDAVFDPRTIPESYILLRNIQKVSFSSVFVDIENVVDMFSERTPVLICENNQILATGSSLLDAFDRLEVCEATAHSIIAARDIGEMVHISDEEIKEIDDAFNLN